MKTENECKTLLNERLQMFSNIQQTAQYDENFKPSPDYWKLVGQIEALNWVLAMEKKEEKS